MKKQVLNEIENLVKKFNEKNEVHSEQYTMKPFQYKRGGYSLKIEYGMFFSSDMAELMELVMKNKLLLRLGTYSGHDRLAYLEIQ